MADDKPGVERPADRGGERTIEAQRGDKGIIVMPVDTAPMVDITDVAPSGPPAPQQAAPADSAPESSSSPES